MYNEVSCAESYMLWSNIHLNFFFSSLSCW